MASTLAKTIDDAIIEARRIVSDARVPYRYSDDSMIAHLNTALADVYRYRPDAYIGNFTIGTLGANPVTSYASSDLGQGILFPLDNRLFFSAVVMYIAGRAELADDEYTENSRAMQLLTSARAVLIGEGG